MKRQFPAIGVKQLLETRLHELVLNMQDDDDVNSLWEMAPIALVLFDVCEKLELLPRHVLPEALIDRIESAGMIRLWPTLTETEEADMIETGNDTRQIEEPPSLDAKYQESINEFEMWRGPRPFFGA